MFAPENVKIAPSASNAPPTTPRIKANVFAIPSVMLFQFSLTATTKPAAPAAISPKPRGIFAPLSVRSAPITSEAPDIIMNNCARASSMMFFSLSIFISIASLRKSYSGNSNSKPPPPPPAPPPEDDLSSGLNTFNSSKPAVYCLSFFAASPAPSRLSSRAPAPPAALSRPE